MAKQLQKPLLLQRKFENVTGVKKEPVAEGKADNDGTEDKQGQPQTPHGA